MQSHDPPGDGLWSPIEWARQAYQRGDRFFQIDLVVSVIKVVEDQGALRTQTVRPPMPADHLGLIEDQGCRLEQVSTSYVAQGTSTAVFGIGKKHEVRTTGLWSRCMCFVDRPRQFP